MGSIVIITTGQPSTNPRLVKEAISLKKSGFSVTVIYSFWDDWAELADEEILKSNQTISWIKVGGTKRKNYLLFLVTKIAQKTSSYLVNLFSNNVFIQAQTQYRSFFPALSAAFKNKADLYIAHNIGALPVAALASKKNNSKFAFDFEDFYRGETNEEKYLHRINLLENKFLQKTVYTTAASFLIGIAYKNKYNFLNPVVISNVFSKKFSPQNITEYNKNSVLKLFWFSQTVGLNRGLQDIIQAINLVEDSVIELTILGKADQQIILQLKNLLKKNQHKIIWHSNVNENELFYLATQFDVGLALEPSFSINNNIALSNKIFTYITVGLAVVVSNTQAQEQFIDENEGIGFKYNIGNFEQLSDILKLYINNPKLLNEHKKNALLLANTKYNWELEEQKLIQLINMHV